jgi:quinol-cytochrome oxidoreductase complex cytochrome b subunit
LGFTPYNDIRFALLGGSTVGQAALLRAYVWHCIGLPLIAVILLGVHFWRVRKDQGISFRSVASSVVAPPRRSAIRREGDAATESGGAQR